ncbi:response regulator [bacterium]|nr:response regulator [bacterium]
MHSYRYVIAVVLFGIFGYMLYLAYGDVKRKTIEEYNAQQMILAQQAATGIENFFAQCYRELDYLAQLDDIVDFNERGQQIMQDYLESHADIVTAITRMDSHGIITYTVPDNPQSIGADISSQEHVQTLLRGERPVVSEVFTAVQGYEAVAYHVPVFNGDEFTGSIAMLIPFQIITAEYLAEIKPASTGYAWVISEAGVMIHNPVERFVGRPWEETAAGYPEVIDLLQRMMAGESGTTTYDYDMIRDQHVREHRKHAAFCPIHLGNTFWSVCVVTSENDVLATMTSFRNKFVIILALLIAASLVYAYYVTKSMAIMREQQLKEQAARDRVELERQYQQAQKMEAVGRLAAGVAHDLNNLLTPILGYTELILEDLEPDHENYSALQDVEKASLRARDLVQQLLAFGRKQALDAKLLNLNAVVRGVEPLVRRTLREDIQFALHLDPNEPSIRGDESHIEQAILNLVINAQDAMPSGGHLTIDTGVFNLDEQYSLTHSQVKPGRYVMLAISDTGHGMDAQTRERIFEPFFTTKEKSRGTGLGLASVHGVVTQHGGHIWVYSEPGQGATFKLYFPLADTAVDVTRQPVAAKPETKAEAVIVVVEDNEMVRNLAVSVLTRRGYTVHSAQDGTSCLALLAKLEGRLDLLLTDVVMPDMNGKELYSQVSARYPDVRVIYMSGYTDNVISHHGVLDPGVPFLQKPFSVTTLADKVNEVLQG